MIVVADTGPLNYLVLSGQIDLTHALYGTVPLRTAWPSRERSGFSKRLPIATWLT